MRFGTASLGPDSLCCVSSIDVVCGRGSSTSNLPLDSIKCDAKRVLTIVDFPRPLCPVAQWNSISYIALIPRWIAGGTYRRASR
jgi:hypothetical protein